MKNNHHYIIKILFLLCTISISNKAFSQTTVVINEDVGSGILFVEEGAPIEATVKVNQRGQATINSNREVVFKPGTWIKTGGFLESKIDNSIPDNPIDPGKNWIFSRSFDENGTLTGESISYYDKLGKPTQSHWKDLSKNIILGSQIVYDAYGRGVLNTLAAPVNEEGLWGYDDHFITNSLNEYTYNDFDKEGTGYGSVNDPKPVDNYNSTFCSLGAYYSNSNESEPYVPATSFPYSRVEYNPFFPGQQRRASAAGEQMKMGMGHESQTYTLSVGYGELNAYNPDIPPDFKATKILMMDNNDNKFISYTDLEGNLIATCRTGSNDVVSLDFSILSNSPYVIHIPSGVNTTLFFEEFSSLVYGYYTINDIMNDENITPGGNQWLGGSINLNPGIYSIHYHQIRGGVDDNEADISSLELNYHTFTWYEYDKAGRLLKSTDPKGIETTMEYNSTGELLSSYHPDEGLTKYYYHNDGRIKASVNAQQRFDAATGNVKYSYTLYDDNLRVTEIGIIEEPGDESSHNFAPSRYDTRTDITRTGYDTPDEELENMYPASGLEQKNLRGRVSYTETGKYSYNSQNSFVPSHKTWYSYDEYGRAEWTAQHHEDLGLKVIRYEYNPNGQVEKVVYQPGDDEEQMEHVYSYDTDIRLKSVTSTKIIDETAYEQTTKYDYYTHGPLKRVEIGNGLQGIDYVYNINGMLKAINHAGIDLVQNGQPLDPGKDGYQSSPIPKDVFGMTLNYYNGDYTRENTYLETGFPGGQNQYNGNAKSVSWKIPEQSRHGNLANPHIYLPTETQVWAYKYNYNDKYWLTNASFGRHDIINGTFNSTNYYSVSGIDYDKNGNLTHLNRAGYGDDLQMDELHYSYSNSNSNKLSTVSDLFTHPNHLNDIKYGPHNYTYNHIGQLTAINSANHKDRYLTYNGYGNMKEVFVDNASNATALQKIAEYTYNDLGYRSGKDVNIPGKEIQKTRYIYDINGNVMAIYFADVDNEYRLLEQPVYGSGRIGTFLFGSQKYFYELTDHLGSVRAIVSRDEQGEIEVNEYADYYPYGMPMPGRRLTSPGNYRYGYQGQFAEEDDETGYNSFELRTYDPRIGRWLSCDPMGQYASPYVGMGNNPVNHIDPTGGVDGPGNFWAKLFGAKDYTVEEMEDNFGQYNFEKGDRIDLAAVKIVAKANKVAPGRNIIWDIIFGERTYKGYSVNCFGYATGHMVTNITIDNNPASMFIGGSRAIKSSKLLFGRNAAKQSTSLVKTGTQFSKHSLQRLAQRGVTQDMAELAISKGQKFYDPLNKSINYVLPNGFASGKSLLVGTNPLTGEVTTVIRSSKNLINSRFIPIK